MATKLSTPSKSSIALSFETEARVNILALAGTTHCGDGICAKDAEVNTYIAKNSKERNRGVAETVLNHYATGYKETLSGKRRSWGVDSDMLTLSFVQWFRRARTLR